VNLPFTLEQFLQVFADYNRAVWPAQNLLIVLALALVAASFLPSRIPASIIPLGLALLWTWMGAVYHFGFFRRINPVAVVFGVAFLAEALLLAVWGLRTQSLTFRPRHTSRAWAGAVLLLYALVIYPKLAITLGHLYPAQPTFGLPCPTTIASLGLLLWAAPRPPWWVWLIPLLWAAVGTSAALQLGMREDFGLLAAGAIVVALEWDAVRGARMRAA
jgi:uncharacterized protein DUF6064